MKKGRGHGGHERNSAGGAGDHELWKHTAASIEPLKRKKQRVHAAVGVVEPGAATAKPHGEHSGPRPSRHRAAAELLPAAPVAKPIVLKKAPDIAAFDRNSARKLRGGRADIEARVDLHGMRQAEAHQALRRFLFSCQSRGLRFVLVITGKGKSAGASRAPYAHEDQDRGVLKRNVPRWLDEPDMRAIVVSYTAAAIQHGGEGAIYVHLRAKHRM